jgi:hypothetical protein
MTRSGVSPAQWSALSQIVAGQAAEVITLSLVVEIAGVEVGTATIDALLKRAMIVRNGNAYVATKHGRQELRSHRRRVAASRSTYCSRKVRYRDELAAKMALAETQRSDGDSGRAERRSYRCPRCDGYHLTST